MFATQVFKWMPQSRDLKQPKQNWLWPLMNPDFSVPLCSTRGSSCTIDGSFRHQESRRDALILPLRKALQNWRVETKRFTSRHHCSCSHRLKWAENVRWKWISWLTSCTWLRCRVIHCMCCVCKDMYIGVRSVSWIINLVYRISIFIVCKSVWGCCFFSCSQSYTFVSYPLFNFINDTWCY